MGQDGKAAATLLLGAALACATASPALAGSAPGGANAAEAAPGAGAAQAPSAPLSGGSEYGVLSKPASVQRPVVGLLGVPATASAGRPPRVTLRIDERPATVVQVRVTVTDLSTRKPAIVVRVGWVHTGRTVAVHWPR